MNNWLAALIVMALIFGGLGIARQMGLLDATPDVRPAAYLPARDDSEITNAAWKAIAKHTGNRDFTILDSRWVVTLDERIALVVAVEYGQTQSIYLLYVDFEAEGQINLDVVREIE